MWKRCLITLAFAAASCGSMTHATPLEIKIPQATQITAADGTIATAQIVQGTEAQPLLIVTFSDGSARIYFLSTTGPGPGPLPPTPPTPSETKLTIVVVEEPATNTPEQSKVITSTTFADEAKKKHTFLGLVTPDAADAVTKEVPASLAPFLTEAKLHKLPWIMFANPQGKIVWQGPPPATEAQLLETLHTYGGK